MINLKMYYVLTKDKDSRIYWNLFNYRGLRLEMECINKYIRRGSVKLIYRTKVSDFLMKGELSALVQGNSIHIL